MGTGASTNKQLKCPKDYEQAKFAMILKLFDKLDNNGDHVVDLEELKNISHLHVKNRVTICNSQIKQEQQQLIWDKERLGKQQEIAQKALKQKCQQEFQSLETHSAQKVENINNRIVYYNSLDENQRCQEFKKIVCTGNHVDFWKFFNYMQDKTYDISNIEF